jgi:hypothetical protein
LPSCASCQADNSAVSDYTLVRQNPHLGFGGQNLLSLFQSGDRHRAGHRRKSFQKFVERFSTFERVEQRLERDSCSAKDRSSSQNIRVLDDYILAGCLIPLPSERIISSVAVASGEWLAPGVESGSTLRGSSSSAGERCVPPELEQLGRRYQEIVGTQKYQGNKSARLRRLNRKRISSDRRAHTSGIELVREDREGFHALPPRCPPHTRSWQ